MEKFLTTSELAKLFNLGRQTLHFYDRKNVFKPAYRNPENGYRMYSHNQISQLAFIIYLRTIGFSLDKIKELIGKGNVDFTMKQLKTQSGLLKEQYKEIFKIDTVIQRKMNFVKQKMEKTDFNKSRIQIFPSVPYVEIGHEKVLYENEIFYYFPTIVFYEYKKERSEYEKRFAAYIDTVEEKEDYLNQIQYTKRRKAVCCYHLGPYEDIIKTISRIREEYKEINLSDDFVCMNVIDQFWENDTNQFITEIYIPILE